MAIEELNDKFPLGMRVLAVDDDQVCLKNLEGLLQASQYKVTTTTQAKEALEMLRQNRNRFDIIIIDVHMPNMDGLKLLELVAVEMDLPVVMLLVNSDPKLVMKGITHGACDFLMKPVRLEELQIIWQHVIRRKKKEAKQPNKLDVQDKAKQPNKQQLEEQLDEENDKGKDNETDNDGSGGSGAQNEPRVIWSTELHRKFIESVNILSIEKKAVPTKILEHMNVEGLSRENVAIHLQKYRASQRRQH